MSVHSLPTEGVQRFVDTSALLRALPEPERGRHSEAGDVALLLEDDAEVCTFVTTEFRLCVRRIFEAASQSLTADHRHLSKDVFLRELENQFWWSLPTIRPTAMKVFEYLQHRIDIGGADLGARPWLNNERTYLVVAVDKWIRNKRISPLVFDNDLPLSQIPLLAGDEGASCTNWDELKDLVKVLGPARLAAAFESFKPLPEGKCLRDVPADQQEVLMGDWPSLDEATEVVRKCAEALGDLLVFLWANPGQQVVGDDEAFAELSRLPAFKHHEVSYRRWRTHAERHDGKGRPITIRTKDDEVIGELANYDDTTVRVDSERPIAHPGDEVSLHWCGSDHPARVLWQAEREGRFLQALRVQAIPHELR